jgi:hypothetical protein
MYKLEILGLGITGQWFGIQISEFRVQGSRLRVQGLGFTFRDIKDKGLGFKVVYS